MKFFWRITLAFAISTSFIKPLQADENNKQPGQFESFQATQQGVQKMAQAGATDSGRRSDQIIGRGLQVGDPAVGRKLQMGHFARG